MMIVDAINNAGNEHAVWFLVTAYLESLHHFRTCLELPLAVIALPLGGVADLRARLASLRNYRNTREHGSAPAAELSAVLRAAVERLDAQLA